MAFYHCGQTDKVQRVTLFLTYTLRGGTRDNASDKTLDDMSTQMLNQRQICLALHLLNAQAVNIVIPMMYALHGHTHIRYCSKS